MADIVCRLCHEIICSSEIIVDITRQELAEAMQRLGLVEITRQELAEAMQRLGFGDDLLQDGLNALRKILIQKGHQKIESQMDLIMKSFEDHYILVHNVMPPFAELELPNG